MTERTGPRWQPITGLTFAARQIEEMLETGHLQHESLKLALAKPRMLDAYTTGRVLARFTVQRDDLWRFDEQLRRWANEELTSSQRAEVERLKGEMLRLYEVIDAVLRLAGEVQRSKVEK